MKSKKKDWKQYLKKIWNFIWNDDSIWSWLLNLILAFLIIRYLIYPLLGIILGTSYPIVAVVSESMEHKLSDGTICGKRFEEFETLEFPPHHLLPCE